MGLLGTIGNIVKGAGRVATAVIPGQLDDRIFEAGVSAVSGIGRRSKPRGIAQQPQLPSNLPVPRDPDTNSGGLIGQRGSGAVFEPSPIDLGPVQFDPFALAGGGRQSQQSDLPAKGFQGALMSAMVAKTVRSKSGRAVLEAMTSGSLQGGMIQQTTMVETPRGVENHSPPGFRTVYVMGEPYAVFKPLAEALGLLPKESKAVLTRADLKCFTKADRLGKRLKGLTQKSGKYKVTNR